LTVELLGAAPLTCTDIGPADVRPPADSLCSPHGGACRGPIRPWISDCTSPLVRGSAGGLAKDVNALDPQGR